MRAAEKMLINNKREHINSRTCRIINEWQSRGCQLYDTYK